MVTPARVLARFRRVPRRGVLALADRVCGALVGVERLHLVQEPFVPPASR
jgi:hypothetical protein